MFEDDSLARHECLQRASLHLVILLFAAQAHAVERRPPPVVIDLFDNNLVAQAACLVQLVEVLREQIVLLFEPLEFPIQGMYV